MRIHTVLKNVYILFIRNFGCFFFLSEKVIENLSTWPESNWTRKSFILQGWENQKNLNSFSTAIRQKRAKATVWTAAESRWTLIKTFQTFWIICFAATTTGFDLISEVSFHFVTKFFSSFACIYLSQKLEANQMNKNKINKIQFLLEQSEVFFPPLKYQFIFKYI